MDAEGDIQDQVNLGTLCIQHPTNSKDQFLRAADRKGCPEKPALEEGCPLPEGSSTALMAGAICHTNTGTGLVSFHHRAAHAVGL